MTAQGIKEIDFETHIFNYLTGNDAGGYIVSLSVVTKAVAYISHLSLPSSLFLIIIPSRCGGFTVPSVFHISGILFKTLSGVQFIPSLEVLVAIFCGPKNI